MKMKTKTKSFLISFHGNETFNYFKIISLIQGKMKIIFHEKFVNSLVQQPLHKTMKLDAYQKPYSRQFPYKQQTHSINSSATTCGLPSADTSFIKSKQKARIILIIIIKMLNGWLSFITFHTPPQSSTTPRHLIEKLMRLCCNNFLVDTKR